MKVNRKLAKTIKAMRTCLFYFWLVCYFVFYLPEIIFLYVYIEYLYMKLMFISLCEYIKENLFPDE